MHSQTHPAYADYPEHPYISPARDLDAWAENPGRFPYGKVARQQMQRLPEGVLPGHIVMLWRIHFGSFTNQTPIPEYFEYRYGVDSAEAIQTLLEKGYIRICTARESLDALNLDDLRGLLRQSGLATTGKKADVLRRIEENMPEQALAPRFSLRKYQITPAGQGLLEKYEAVIQRHGPKE